MSEKVTQMQKERKRNVITLEIQADVLERLAHGICN